jgi:hypothetical protein
LDVTDSAEIDELKHWADVMNMANGYGAAFNRKTATDKTIVEISTCREWCNSMTAEFGLSVGEPESNLKDPPDCYVIVESRHLGVELIQLVEPEHKQRATNGESPYAGQLFEDMQWSKERLLLRLNNEIKKKGNKYQESRQCVEVLLIHTAETWLNSTQACEWLRDVEFKSHPNIASTFLLFEYEPGRDVEHWPVFWLYGDLGETASLRHLGRMAPESRCL